LVFLLPVAGCGDVLRLIKLPSVSSPFLFHIFLSAIPDWAEEMLQGDEEM
jgi:hypothetical protein